MTSLPSPASPGKPKLGESNGDREYLMQVLRARDGSCEVDFKHTGQHRRCVETPRDQRRGRPAMGD
jgi:hypothetical protein